MAAAKKLIENDDPDSPEAFGVKQYLNSPVAKIASSCGFVRDDYPKRSDERWVKKLSNGKEAWLRTESPNREWEEPMDFKDPSGRKGGREWELLEVTPTHACKHCNQERRLNKKPCPHCKQKAGVASFNKFRSLIRANEVAMSYTLGAFMQRLATWPEGVPKNFEESTRQLVRTKILEGLGVDDPDDPESTVKREVASRDWENILLRNGFKYRDMGIRGYERKFGASTMVNVGNSTKPDCVLIGVYYMYGDDRWQLDTSASVSIRDMLDYINDYVPVAQLHEARKVKVEANPVPDPDDPVVSVNNFVQSKIPYVSEYIQLVNALNAHPEMEVDGKLTRHGNYVHQNSTSFEMTVDNTPEQLDVLGGDFWRVVDHVEKLIKEEVVSINHKIYRALEREHDWLQSDEAVVDSIEANDYKFDEDGRLGDGELKYDQLDPDAQEAARDNYREGNLDYEWWDHIYEEWIAELEEMGWRNPEINFSGFSSQGDGASFTANGLDFRKWAAWHMSSKVIEKGHPYTDELKESVDDADDPQMFMQQYLKTHFDDSAILAVYAYINAHRHGETACEHCEGTGVDPQFANAQDFNHHPCPACDGEGEHEDGSYRQVVHLWNAAGKELDVLFTRIAERTGNTQRNDTAIQALFDYMNDPGGNYSEVAALSHSAGKEISAAVNLLRGKPTTESVDNPDDPPREHLLHMGRPCDCPEPCCVCGAYCTLNHYDLAGVQLPRYHICHQCDMASGAPLHNIGESTRIPSTFSRINKTFIKVANGTIVVSPMRGGDEYWISAPGHRQQRVSIRELHGVIHQLVNLCGGPIPYMPGPRYESDVDDPQHYIDELPAKPNPGEMVNLTCPNCGKTRVREQPAPPMTLDPVCCGRRLRESDDVDDPQHYIDQAVVKLKPQTGVQSKALNYRYAGSKTPLYGTVIYSVTNARGVSYYVQFPHAPSFSGYYDHADLVPDARLSELGESGEDDPTLFMQSLDQMPDHELIDTSNGSSMSMNCACGQWSIGSAARDEADRVTFDRMAKEEFEHHIAFKRPEDARDPGDKLRARNFITSLRPHKPQQEGYNFPDLGEQDKPEHWDDGEPPDVDDPSVVLKHEVAQRSEPIKELEVRGRRWYRRGAGGVYCKAYIYINDKLVHVTPEQYGYGDHYLTLATDWLRRNGYLDDLLPDPRDPIWYLRDKHGIKLSYGVRDVPRERDL